jgi:molybdenum cofactor cytidylyltransferase
MPGISAIITAAGESTRMGSPKSLLPWKGTTLLEYQVRCLLDAGCAEVVVVLGHAAEMVEPHVTGQHVRHVLNPLYRQGKTTSIKAGIGAISDDADGILLLAVDQPRTAEITRQVLEAHNARRPAITSPRHEGHGGHPLVFDASLRPELESITEENQGIRQVFEAHRDEVYEVPIDDAMLRLDLNTPEDYEQAKQRYGA